MNIKVTGSFKDEASYFNEERDALREGLNYSSDPSAFKEAIENKDALAIMREAQDLHATTSGVVNLISMVEYLCWLFSDFNPKLCGDLILEASMWDNLTLTGINFSEVSLDTGDDDYFEGFIDCFINRLRIVKKADNLTSADLAESYLTLFERSVVNELTLAVDGSNSDISVEEFKKAIESEIREKNIPKTIMIEFV